LNLWGNAREGSDVIEIEAPTKEPLLSERKARSAGSAVELHRVTRTFARRRGRITALADLSLAAQEREVLGVVGPSGCGKSTLLELIAGLQQPSSGDVSVDGRTGANERLERCALMPQRDLLFPWRSALDNAGLALELAGARRAEARRRVQPLFERFGLAGFERARPYELSGGMRQRVAFLRTLLTGKPVLLLDEPFGSLDSISRARMQEWLADALLVEPRTVVLVSHDVEEALFLCDRVLVLSERPGSVAAEIAVTLPRPRPRRETVTSPAFARLKEQALEALG
jgi:ABC-type nitrate/sulfonate/bicarbonate transport system ATPase subunit